MTAPDQAPTASNDTAAPSLIRNRRYLTWLVSDTATGLSNALASFAIPLLALMVTDDPAQAGVIGGIGMAVRVVTLLAGGVLADRHSRLRLMLVGGLVGLALAAGFTLLAVTDALTFVALLVVNALINARAGIFGPADESAIKELVPPAAMGRAQAANQGRDAVLSLVGGPLGGMLLVAGGWLVGAGMAAAQLVAAATAWRLVRQGRHSEEPTDAAADAASGASIAEADADAPAPDARRSALREIREGFAWLFSRTDLRGVILISTLINLGFNAGITTVVYSLQQSGHSPAVIGWVSAGISVVMLAGALVAGAAVRRVRAGALMLAGLIAATAGVLALTLVHDPIGIVLVLGASVLLVPALNAGLMGYFMVATPTRLLGRANSASAVFAMGALPLGPIIAGLGLAWGGRDATLLVCAGICLVSVLLAIMSRSLRSLPAEGGWTEHARAHGTD